MAGIKENRNGTQHHPIRDRVCAGLDSLALGDEPPGAFRGAVV